MRIILLPLMLFGSLGCSTIVRTTLPFNDLPAPSGPYTVATEIETWKDNSRLEAFTENPSDIRRIVVQYWYPTAASISAESNTHPYIDQPDKRMSAFAQAMGLPQFLVEHIQEVKTHSLYGQKVHPDTGALPVVIFSHGLGGMKSQNTIQAEELASHGYLVIAADHAFDAYLTIFDDATTADYRSSGDDISNEAEFWAVRGPQLETRTHDISFILDMVSSRKTNPNDVEEVNVLWQRADLNRVGIFGHSFGGATSLMALSRDSRIRAAIALDGWMVPVPETKISEGSRKPLMYIGQESWDEPLNYEKLSRFVESSSEYVTSEIWEGTKHMDFADAPHLSDFARRIGFAGKMPSEELRTRLNRKILTFFATHLSYPAPQAGLMSTGMPLSNDANHPGNH